MTSFAQMNKTGQPPMNLKYGGKENTDFMAQFIIKKFVSTNASFFYSCTFYPMKIVLMMLFSSPIILLTGFQSSSIRYFFDTRAN